MILVKIGVIDKGTAAVESVGRAAKATTVKINAFGSVLKGVFAGGALLGGAKMIINEFRKMTGEAMAFQSAMVKLSVVGQVSDTTLASVSKQARELSLTTEHSAVSISKAALEMVKMGYSADQVKKALPNALNLATFAGEDLTYAAKNMVNIMKAFGKSASESTHIVDVMAKALNKTSLGLKDYMEGMAYVAPIAKNLNYSFEETTALLGILSDISLKGSLGGTTLKNSMLKLLDPTAKVATALKGMDLSSTSLTEVMKTLKDKGLSVSDMFKQFDIRALTGALAMGAMSKESEKLIRELYGVTDASKSAAEAAQEIRDKDFTMQWVMVRNAIVNVGIALNEAFGTNHQSLAKALRDKFVEMAKWLEVNRDRLNDLVTKGVNVVTAAFKFLAENSKQVLTIFGAIVAARMIRGFVMLADVLGRVKIAMSFAGPAANGIGDIILRMNVLVAVATTLYGIFTKITDEISKSIDRTTALSITNKPNTEKEIQYVKKILDAYGAANLSASGRMGQMALASGHFVQGNTSDKSVADLLAAKQAYIKEFAGGRKGILDPFIKSEEATRAWLNSLKNTLVVLEKVKEVEKTDIDEDTRPRGEPEPKAIDTVNQNKFKRYLAAYRKAYAKMLAEKAKAEQEAIDKRARLDEAFQKSKDALTNANEQRDSFSFWGGKDTIRSANAKIDKKYIPLARNAEETKTAINYAEAAEAEKALVLKEKVAGYYDYLSEYSVSTATKASSLMGQIEDAKLQRTLDRFETEKTALQKRYELEGTLAEGNAFKQAMIEQQLAAKTAILDDKAQKAKDAAARKSKTRSMFEAAISGSLAVVNTVRDAPGPFFAKAAAGAGMAALVGLEIAAIASQNYRYGSKGQVTGDGNSTSDSIVARISKKERVLSEREIDSAGGNEMIQRLIDRGSRAAKGVTIMVEKFYGSKAFVRELIPVIREEFAR